MGTTGPQSFLLPHSPSEKDVDDWRALVVVNINYAPTICKVT